MPLTIFDHQNFACYDSVVDPDGPHQIGGDPNLRGISFHGIDNVVHLVALLSGEDASVNFIPEGLSRLPLCYGFRFATYSSEFRYSVPNDAQVEIPPGNVDENDNLCKVDHGHRYDPNFPYGGHPDVFPETRIRFQRRPYDPTKAEDALELQGVFGLEQLSPSEMNRAVEIGLGNRKYVSDPELYSYLGWSDQEKVKFQGCCPFYQRAPDRTCDDPQCPSDEDEDTVNVIAVHVPDDKLMWGDTYVQTIFTMCTKCHRIVVDNQCT